MLILELEWLTESYQAAHLNSIVRFSIILFLKLRHFQCLSFGLSCERKGKFHNIDKICKNEIKGQIYNESNRSIT